MKSNPFESSRKIKEIAHRHGFQFCGLSAAGYLEEEAPRLEAWLNQGMQGQMTYMENHFDKRLDPRKLVDGCQSVISLVYNYFPSPNHSLLHDSFKVSKYAFGVDYHSVVKEKMKAMWDDMQNEMGEFQGRMFVDSAPVLEKAWARKSGIGWIGKNANLIIPKQGSFYFLAEMLVDFPVVSDGPIKDFCGTCTRCIEACPTDAITPYVVDGSKCISYFTIELKKGLPIEIQADFQDWIFGCDICQDVCPWNRHAKAHEEPQFEPKQEMVGLTKSDWEELSEQAFKELFHYSALKRTQLAGIRRSIAHVKKMEP
jgi:epoxyqueuosine reductase